MNNYKSFTDEELVLALKKKLKIQEIAESLQSSQSIVHKRIRKLGLSTKDFKLDENVFEKIDCEEKAYWLGFLYADGCVNKNKVIEISLKYDDINHLYKFCDFIKCDYNKVKTRFLRCGGKEFKACRWGTKRLKLFNDLIKLGCHPQKSLNLKFPDLSIFSEKELVFDFIRGYVDGDGCLGLKMNKIKSPTLTFQVVGTFEFLTEMCKILEIDSVPFHKNKRYPNSNTYAIFLCSQKALNAAKQLYENANVFLDRKYNIYQFAVSQSNL